MFQKCAIVNIMLLLCYKHIDVVANVTLTISSFDGQYFSQTTAKLRHFQAFETGGHQVSTGLNRKMIDSQSYFVFIKTNNLPLAN